MCSLQDYKKRQEFEQFMKNISHSEHRYEYVSISEVLIIYTIFVCGGDQIWNDS